MNQASVEVAFQITGSGPVAGTFTWNDNTVTFTPQGLWKTHHLYTLTIQNTAADANGTPMAEAFTQTFRPGLNMNDINAAAASRGNDVIPVLIRFFLFWKDSGGCRWIF